MARRLAKALFWGMAGLVAAVGVLDTGLRFANLEGPLKHHLVGRAARRGWNIGIAGPVTARLLPLPHIEAAEFSLSNRRDQKLLAAHAATFRLSLRRSLFLELEIDRPEIFVSFDRNGDLNWQRPRSGPVGRAPRPPDMRAIVRDGTISVLDERRPGAHLAIEHADIALLLDQESLDIDAGLSVDGKRTTLKANLARSAGEHLAGPLDVQVESLAAILDSWSRFRGDEHPPDLGAAFLGSFSVATTRLEWTGKELSIKEAAFSLGARRRDGQALGTTRGVANLTLALPPRVTVALGLEIPELQFSDFMTGHANWVALGQLFADKSLAALDATPAGGSVEVGLAIDKGFLNDQPVQAIKVTVTLADHKGTLTTSASLPGGTHLHSQTTLSGERNQRRIEGSVELRGDAPAKTLQWLLPKWLQPDKPTPAVIADAPFDISLKVTPLGVGVHSINANVLLSGVSGTGDATIKAAPESGSRADLDGSFRIGSLDLLSYLPLATQRGVQSLKLGGIDFRFKSAIDLDNPALPMDVLRADLGAKQVEIGLTPSPAAPTVPTSARGALLDAETTRTFGAWLAALPSRLDGYAHAGPAHSTLAKAFPSIDADLTRLETILYHLNFKNPLRLSAQTLLLLQGEHRSALSDASLSLLARAVPGHRKISTVFAEARLGEGDLGGARLSSGALVFEADLDRSSQPTHVSAIRLPSLSIAGDIDDPINPYGVPGVIGLPAAPRRVPVALNVRQLVADPGNLSATVDRLVLGDLATFENVEIEASENRGGLLSVAISNASGVAAADEKTCLPAENKIAHVLDFRAELAGVEAPLDEAYGLLDSGTAEHGPRRPLIRRLSACGFTTRDAAVLPHLQLGLGDSSTVSGRLESRAPRRRSDLAELEGRIDATVQDRPRLASIGQLGQDLLLPALAPLWRQPPSTTKIGIAGRVRLHRDGLASDGPLRLSLGRSSRSGADSFSVELQGLDLTLPDRGRGVLGLDLQKFGFGDGLGHFELDGPGGGRSMLSLQQRTPGGRCGRQANLQADIALGPIDHGIDMPAVKRFVAHVGALAKVHAPVTAPSPCDPLDVTLAAQEIRAWPDLVDAFTDLAGARRAAQQAPALRDLELALHVARDRTVTYTVRTALVRVSGEAGLPCKPGEGFQSEGTLAVIDGKWRGESKGTVTCLGLNEVLRIADATVGHRLESPTVSLRAGHFREISFDLKLPAFTLAGLSLASGSIKWDGTLALDIENSKIQTVIDLLDLQAVRRQGFKTIGHVEFANGDITQGQLSLVDPLVDQERDQFTDARVHWPDIVHIDARGGLSEKTINAKVVVRGPNWVSADGKDVCPTPGSPIHWFPGFVETIPICVSLTGGKECAKPPFPHVATIYEYKCAPIKQ